MPSWPSASFSSADGKPWLGLPRARRAITVALALALSLPLAHAERQTAPHKTILLVRTAGDDPVINRVRADLSGAGWRIMEIAGQDENQTRESLAALASELKATAALRVDATTGRIYLHIRRTWGKVDEVLRSEDGRVDGRILALRATEALRAHGLDIGPTPLPEEPNETGAPTQSEKRRVSRSPGPADRHGTAPGRAAAPTRAAEGPAASKQGLWFELAPTAVGSPGGLGYAVSGWIGARFELSRLWSVAATGIVPLWSRRVVESEGSARVATSLFGLGLERVWFRRPGGYWATGLGAAGLATVMQGRQAQAGYHVLTDTVVTVAADLYMRGGWRVLPDWTAFGALLGGVSCPEVEVGFGDRVVRTWGQPYGMLALGVEFRTLAW